MEQSQESKLVHQILRNKRARERRNRDRNGTRPERSPSLSEPNEPEAVENQNRSALRLGSKETSPTSTNDLNMAEIEIGIFQRGCLSRRVESLPALRQRIPVLEAERNAQHRTIVWQCTCPDAREKPSHLDPLAQLQT